MSNKAGVCLCAVVLFVQAVTASAQAIDADGQIPFENGSVSPTKGVDSPNADSLLPIWVRTYNSVSEDQGYAIATDGSNVYTVGGSSGGQFGIYLLKYSSNGNLVWDKTWENNVDLVWVHSMAIDSSYLYLVGKTKKYGSDNGDVLLLKFDLNGRLIWNKTWGGRNDESANSVAVDGSNLYVTGSTSDYNTNSVDVLILEYDLDGNLIWTKTWDGGLSDWGESIAVDNSNIYICGSTTVNGSNVVDILALKFDLNGNLLWSKTWGGKNNDWAYSIAVDSSDIYIAGQSNCYGIGLDDALILKYDLNGNLIWDKTWGGNDSESAHSIAVDDSNIYATGWTSSYGSGAIDAFVLKYDLNGNMLWNKTWGSKKRDWVESMTISNSYLYLAGERDNESQDFIQTFVLKCDLNGGNSIYPFVVNTIPISGSTNVSTNTNIFITFSEAMNKAETETAISSSPSITGTFTWNATGKIVAWDPNLDLQANTTYTVAISTNAKSQKNVNMQKPFTFSFSTFSLPDIYLPYIVATSPANGSTNVFTTIKLFIQWNESMNRSSAENAFAPSPMIMCRWSWSVVTQICTPTSQLQFDTKYMIAITALAMDTAGNPMKNPYLISFSTKPPNPVPPVITNTKPKNNSIDIQRNSSITITFSQEMNRTATEGAISASPSIIGIFTWDATGKTVIWDPDADLQADAKYSITISTKTRSKTGLYLPTSYTFSFTTAQIQDITPPCVISTYPTDKEKEVARGTKIIIIFSEPMNLTATESAISILPGSIGQRTWNATYDSLNLTALLEDGKTYTVTISTAAKDNSGNKMVSPYTFTFTTKYIETAAIGINLILLGILILTIAFFLIAAILIMRRKTKNCPECGKSIQRDVNICPVCGYDFIKKTKSITQNRKKEKLPENPPPESAKTKSSDRRGIAIQKVRERRSRVMKK